MNKGIETHSGIAGVITERNMKVGLPGLGVICKHEDHRSNLGSHISSDAFSGELSLTSVSLAVVAVGSGGVGVGMEGIART